MSVIIEKLQKEQADEYEELLNSIPTTLLYVSFKYQRLLEHLLSDSEPIYLVAREHGQLVGALPAFVRYNAQYGPVLNSLPFFGSNGGLIVSSKAGHRQSVKLALLDAFDRLGSELDVTISTLIANPLDEEMDFYTVHWSHTWRDERIGQITPLPVKWQDIADLQEQLMTIFHQKTRNSIRKAQKSHLVVYHSDSLESLQLLSNLHKENIQVLGGSVKSWEVFKTIRDVFTYDQDYRVYLAAKDDQVIATLLVFFYNQTAEYFTPATLEGYRIYQPMSLLIYQAMQDAAHQGCQYWNWGGTWLTQDGVYRFKSRWGAQSKPYFYYIREHITPCPLRMLTAAEILAEYPNFYVLPFKVLEKSKN